MAPHHPEPIRRSSRHKAPKRAVTDTIASQYRVSKARKEAASKSDTPAKTARGLLGTLRQSPVPMERQTSIQSDGQENRRDTNAGSSFILNGNRGQSTTPNPSGQDARDPNKRNSVKARLQDVVKILIRQSIINKLTSELAKHVPHNTLKLCPSCERLGLAPEDFVIGNKLADKSYVFSNRRHGSFLAIYVKAHSCPLCRLIMRAIAEQPFAKLKHVVVHGQDQASEGALMRAFCRLTWEVDGRVGWQHKTRRLKISWSDPCYESIYLVMVAEPPSLKERSATLPPTFLGRELCHVNKTKIQLIDEWLRVCSDSHGAECRPEKGTDFDELRESTTFGVIDVVEMSFKELPKGADYVALSYQWGPPDSRFITTQSTVMGITERNGLSQYVDQLPTTIRESIELVRDLRLRYLWIDSLCIVQDSQDAWERNAFVMDLVYGNATLTIAAADGDDAYAGLCAISRPDERDKQCIERCTPDLLLMARYPCETYIRQSNWNTRAWTFQERLLSKRCLVFTKGRVYLQCRKVTMSEDIYMDTAEVGSSLDLDKSPGLDFKDFAKNPLKAYMTNVELYTARLLTKPWDVLSAFYGVAKLLCTQLEGEPVFGLPNSHFDWALLWDPEDAPKRRDPGDNLRFPSWSWCGWDKRRMVYNDYAVSDCMAHLNDWLMNHTWIIWYIRDSKGDLRLVWDPEKTYPRGKVPIINKMRGYQNLHGTTDPRYDFYGREIPEENIGLPRIEFARKIPEFPVRVRTLPPGSTSSGSAFTSPDRGILQFWTWSAYFYLFPVDPHQRHKKDKSLQGRIFSRRFSILDDNGTWAGTIVLDKKWKFDPRQPQHFIAISDARQFWYNRESVLYNNYPNMGDKEWPLYNVLLLGYDGTNQEGSSSTNPSGSGHDTTNSIAYRVGLGKIYQDAFDQACETSHQLQRKEWREIVLG